MVRPRRLVAVAAAATVAMVPVAGCSDDGGKVTFVDDRERCAGFTPTGSRLDDRDLLDAAAAAWQDGEGAGDSRQEPVLGDDAEVCVVYADVSEHGLPRVAMVSDDVDRGAPFTAFFEGMEDDDLDVAHIDGVRYLGDDATAIGVGDGLWLLADGVESASFHAGSAESAHEVDLSASRLVDSRELGAVEGRSAGVLVADTAERTDLVTGAGEDADHHVAAVPLADSPIDPTAVLASADGTTALASAIRAARGDQQLRPPDVRLLGTVDVPGFGTVLASSTTSRGSDRDLVRPLLSIGTGAPAVTVPVGPVFVRDGREAVEGLDPALGWAAGTMLVEASGAPVAYVVAGEPPDGAGGALQLDVRVGRSRQLVGGPLAFVPAGGAVAGAVVGTAPSGAAVPTVPTEAAVTVDR